ncbi:glyceraldehyde-3-phosphate dehydrogenase [Oleiphilus sp. HI0071]|nr:glyceraldehyde-3-phosphate dehydrogenase [Oleiphilus sp. HI0080]KZY62985.1 glyceraldehyde-3-phosphate dehydrogenase [Oleiphilus sp. HI0065]KZY83042.1 glyceraldehyde-3-phosphate dehydrogenase [Oleiphilus sp. HI0071]KZY98788.1 glyceraldehyde-3-phosphate dehydrogenase [Oleiphilus sp. HI0073]KZZ49600.1 glyceraldehyde-3-phosphate dehydrogenase [Oleiphilus sp. HI0122]KZZ70420.1 glyceraldehyde-3-phosphate dehydrogenase [Oleiphilus sp. HI0130]KZZ77742.1 glyceraldehyde-3-phosphate dehydrogenase [Ol
MSNESIQSHFNDWTERESAAEDMIPLIGRLYRENNVVTSVYGRAIINQSVIGLLKSHRFVRQIENKELSAVDSLEVLKVMSGLNLGHARVDIGKLAVAFKERAGGASLEEFLRAELADVVGKGSDSAGQSHDVVLYGFGRIGRLLARILIEKAGGGTNLRLKAIVVRKGGASNDLEKRASLLRRDSVHGPFEGTISVDNDKNQIIANGNCIQVIYSPGPDQVDYTEYGINDAIVIDNTGIWRDEDGLGLHLKSKGVSKVLLTAPGKGDIKNIVYGINNSAIESSDTILSAASCTTNAITPVLKVINDEFGIKNGHVETVHAYTNDQNLIDNYHKGSRRGRSAPLNMVITETGAAKAVSKALPEMAGKLTGNAIRVPTPNVSMAILNLNIEKEATADQINEYLREVSLHSDLAKQIDYVNSEEVVSSDFVGNRRAGIVDAKATIANDGRVILYVWYDNEFGYSAQVVRIANQMAGITYPSFPARS